MSKKAEDEAVERFNEAQKVVWQGMVKIFNIEPMTTKNYMILYQYVYNYCNSIKVLDTASWLTDDYEQEKTESLENDEDDDNDYPEKDNDQQHRMTQYISGEKLYEKCREFLIQHNEKLISACENLSGEPLLEYYTREWQDYKFSSRVLDGLYGYLNRHWSRRKQDENVKDVLNMRSSALQIWRRKMFASLELKLRSAMIEEFRKERAGIPINGRLIMLIANSLLACGADQKRDELFEVYKESFEAPFLEETRNFYTNEVRELREVKKVDGKEYIKRIWRWIEQEERNLSLRFHRSSFPKLQAICNEVMIKSQLEYLKSQFEPLLLDGDLRGLVRLFSRIPKGLQYLHKRFQDYATKQGHLALEQRAKEAFQDPKTYVQTILEVYERCMGLIEKAFGKHPDFMNALGSAAKIFVNSNAVTEKAPPTQQNLKSAELISRYCDLLVRRNLKMTNEEEREEMQRKVITIFKYLEDKDMFLKFYTRYFSKRLLSDLSVSDEAEKSFIAKFTECCGFQYTHPLTRMIRDCQLSKDLTKGFKENGGSEGIIEFSVQILTTGSWPAFPKMVLNLPIVLSASVEGFKEFYCTKFNGRKLQWVHGQSRGELACSGFKGRRYVFGVTAAQMCTLLMFNDATTYPAEALMNGTGMEAKTASTVVGSLVKHQVLSSDVPLAQDLTVPMTAKISLNSAYTNKKVRVDLSKMTAVVQAAKDAEHVRSTVEEDRKNVISACIVRIMKARNTISHQHLMTEIIAQLNSRFAPKVEAIKKSIEILIEKEYMKRNEENNDVYDYVA